MKKDKKHRPHIVLYNVIYALIGGGLGFFLVQFYDYHGLLPTHLSFLSVFIGILLFLIAFLLQLIIHELGHLIFGLVSGYHFLSFRIFNLMFVRINRKISVKKLHIDGTAGQCLMIPPDPVGGMVPAVLYNMGGVLMNMIASFIAMILLYRFYDFRNLAGWLFEFIVIGILIALTNGIPVFSSVLPNDGANAIAVENNPKANRAFYIQMKVNALQTNGVFLHDMPAEWFELPDDEDLNNPLIATLVVFAVSRYLEELYFERAGEILDHYLSVPCTFNSIHRQLLSLEKIYICLIKENDSDDAEKLMTKDLKKFIRSMKNYPSVLRFEYACALLKEHDLRKAERVREQFEKTAADYPYETEIITERRLMKAAEEKAEIS